MKHEFISFLTRKNQFVTTRKVCIHCGVAIEFSPTVEEWLWSPKSSPNYEGTIDGKAKHPKHPLFSRMYIKRIPACESIRMDEALS